MKLLGDSNTKLKKTSKHFDVKIYNFNIPAGNDKLTGKITCPFADECLQFCYAKKGMYRFSNVERALSTRYELSKQDNFVDLLSNELAGKRTKKPLYVRIHDSGDFYSPAYLDKWLAIAERFPNVRFYAYTKSHDFFRGLELPENFDVIFSEGSKLDHKLDKATERHASIFESVEALESAGYVDAHEYDLYATKWFSNTHKVGLVIH